MATVVTGWLSPVLLCASILLMARSFYVIYVRGVGTRPTVVITWLALTFMLCFWTWYLALGGEGVMRELFQPGES
jgi:hypothetical protein